MPARSLARAIPGAAALVLSCAALAGCGGSGGPAQSVASTPPSSGSSAGNASANSGKLTGNFCDDFRNIGKNIPIPAANTGSLSTMVQHDGKYLRQVSAYYDKLASEAPAQAGHEIQLIASAYQELASSITSTSSGSLTKLEQQITSLTTSGAAGNAFRRLIVYVTTKCG